MFIDIVNSTDKLWVRQWFCYQPKFLLISGHMQTNNIKDVLSLFMYFWSSETNSRFPITSEPIDKCSFEISTW